MCAFSPFFGPRLPCLRLPCMDGTLAAFFSHTRRSLPIRPAQMAGPRQVGPTRLAVERAEAPESRRVWNNTGSGSQKDWAEGVRVKTAKSRFWTFCTCAHECFGPNRGSRFSLYVRRTVMRATDRPKAARAKKSIIQKTVKESVSAHALHDSQLIHNP